MMFGFLTGAILGWAGKKLKVLAKWAGKFVFFWIRASHESRHYFVALVYTKIVSQLATGISEGRITDPVLIRWIENVNRWCYEKLKNWKRKK